MCGVVNWRDAVEKPMDKATRGSSTNPTTSGSKTSTEVLGDSVDSEESIDV